MAEIEESAGDELDVNLFLLLESFPNIEELAFNNTLIAGLQQIEEDPLHRLCLQKRDASTEGSHVQQCRERHRFHPNQSSCGENRTVRFDDG